MYIITQLPPGDYPNDYNQANRTRRSRNTKFGMPASERLLKMTERSSSRGLGFFLAACLVLLLCLSPLAHASDNMEHKVGFDLLWMGSAHDLKCRLA